jgi:nitroreductase
MDAIFKRRSIRKYKDQPVEKEKVELLLRAAMQAPTSGNQRPWEFVVVENKDSLKKLSLTSKYSMMVAKAPIAIIMLGNKDLFQYPEDWEKDLGAATENLLLEAVELGLGAVWIGVAPLIDCMENVRAVCELPSNIDPFAIVAVGYPLEEKEPIDRFEQSRIHYEKY